MSDYGWFKLLVRAVGILLLGLSLPMALWSVGDMLVRMFDPAYGGAPLASVVGLYLPGLAGYLAQAGIGLYLLCGSERLIAWCIAGVKGRCAECGYDITAVPGGVCPECGVKIAPVTAPGADTPKT